MSGKGLAAGKNECQCKDKFLWREDGKCLCPPNHMFMENSCFNCQLYANTLPTLEAGIYRCLCKHEMVFDTDKKVCACSDSNSILLGTKCISCSSSIIKGLNRIDSNTCSCDNNLNLFWDKTLNKCICKTNYFYDGSQCLLCSGVTGSTAASNPDNSCVCKPGLTWDTIKLTCYCDGLTIGTTCYPCNSKIGAQGISKADSSQCSCIGQLTWDAFKRLCICGANQIITYEGNCLTCSTDLDANIIGTVDRYNCKCADPYFWDNIRQKCIKCGTGGLANSGNKVKGS
jgi:peptide methionine sulfoxide reductase MsrB